MGMKDIILKQFLKYAVDIAPYLPDSTLITLAKIAQKLAIPRDKKTISYVIEKWEQKHPTTILGRRIIHCLSRKCREKLAINLFINSFFIGNHKRLLVKHEDGFIPPYLIVISPTMRCNLRCKGCYAGEYTQEQDLDFATVDRIVTEAKNMGIYFITISGGEPYIWPGLLKLFEKHNDVYFQTYTNGTLIDKNLAKKLAELGNVAPAISVEGFEKETDLRRGKGIFKKVMQAMQNLKEAGVMYGFSATPTRYNSDMLCSDEFIDFYIKQGCYFGWFFQYIPIGLKPDIKMMATPEQRQKLREHLKHVRHTKPIFIGDFWNDGPFTKGCMAGGGCTEKGSTGYCHINCKGDVEPCVFAHFAVDNIKNKSLREALNSDFFKAIRERRPYCENLLMPCMIIDNPEVLREVVKKYNAYPTHPDADSIVKNKKIVQHLNKYSKRMHQLTDRAFEKEFPACAAWAREACESREFKY